jgi:hypothetical protein
MEDLPPKVLTMDDPKLRALQMFFRLFGWLSLLLFSVLLAAFVFGLKAFDTGGPLNWMLWGGVGDHVAPMLLAVYVVWSVYIIKAARDPVAQRLFLEFTVWANVAHGVVMIPHALMAPEFMVKFATDIPMVFLPAIAWITLRPQSMKRRDA